MNSPCLLALAFALQIPMSAYAQCPTGCFLDRDCDTIDDLTEATLPTDNENCDSDGDNIRDDAELGSATNPRNTDGQDTVDAVDIDSDNDFISDLEESGCTEICTVPAESVLDEDTIPDYRDEDSDGDGIVDRIEAGDDNLATPAWDTDLDGTPDFLDLDSDNDGTPDKEEGAGDTDCDGILNFRDTVDNGGSCGDADGDGIEDPVDNCVNVSNTDQIDLDTDDQGDACDADDDNDGIPDTTDNCPQQENTIQEDLDGDGVGDVCDSDADGDDLDTHEDNCPLRANSDQEDLDNDGLGDACDTDDDNDGISDFDEEIVYGTDPKSSDSDLDSVSDAEELQQGTDPTKPDTDGDGLADGEEKSLGTDPTSKDTDSDGWSDGIEAALGTNPLSAASRLLPTGSGPAGCSAGHGVPLLSFILLLLLGGLFRTWRRCFICLALMATLVSTSASAAEGFNLRTQQRAAFSRGAGVHATTESLRQRDFDLSLFYDYSHRPFVLRENASREARASVIAAEGTAEIRANVGVLQNLEINLSLPMVLHRALGTAGQGNTSTAISDMSVGIRYRLPIPNKRYGVATYGALSLPTGSPSNYTGANTVNVELGATSDVTVGPLLAMVSVGYRARANDTYISTPLSDQLTYTLAADITIHRTGSIAPYLSGGIGIGRGLKQHPMELGAGYRQHIGAVSSGSFEVYTGAGLGLTRAVGVPTFRILSGLAFRFRPIRDSDGDGFPDEIDACVTEPEDMDGYADDDGCPDNDNDLDQIVDSHDLCPGEKEDMDGYEDKDGCPELDNDTDGVLDSVDACPNTPEDHDEYKDEDGCPELDNDADGVEDLNDACPLQPEIRNEYRDEDGCPDDVPEIIFLGQKSVVFNDIQFEGRSATIHIKSHPVLDRIARSLSEQPDVSIRIEGHTDGRGGAADNLRLSQQRALAIMNYLIERGVNESRLSYIGFGETRPVGPNSTRNGRARNRRVEFLVLKQP